MSPSPLEVPERALRLFPHEEPVAVGAPPHRAFLIRRLLAEGDGEDLRWLFRTVDREAAVAALGAGGGRKLDRRSRAFWELVLGVPPSPINPTAAALWPWA